jgi:hypothetical protein
MNSTEKHTMLTTRQTTVPAGASPRRSWSGRGTRGAILAVIVSSLGLGACEITNPGPVQDSFLDDETTHTGLVRGAERSLLIGAMRIFFASATITREIFPGGDTNSHSPRLQFGALPSNEMDEYWNPTQQARFIAEDALRRFDKQGVEATPENRAQATLWAGYANKLLGENFCQVVINGGEAQPPSVALERAEDHFTDAISAAANGQQRQAAYAGRAQTRIQLGDWTGAVADAGQVDTDFVWGIEADPAFVETRNFIAFANLNENYRQYTYHFTYFYDDLGNGFGTGYYTDTGDERVTYTTDPDFPVANASLPGFGNVPWSFDPDFELSDPVILSTGSEMRLYEAEHILLTNPGNFQAAMDLINEVRASYVSDFDQQPLGPLSATSAAEAGTHLKAERLIDGHLKGRRFLDLRRWGGVPGVGNATRDDTPGDYYWPDWGQLSTFFDDEPMATCFPIPDSERDINPNLPTTS